MREVDIRRHLEEALDALTLEGHVITSGGVETPVPRIQLTLAVEIERLVPDKRHARALGEEIKRAVIELYAALDALEGDGG